MCYPHSQVYLPLMEDLRNPAMRTRHWKQLVRVTGGAVNIDTDTLARMTLGELLSLGLHSEYPVCINCSVTAHTGSTGDFFISLQVMGRMWLPLSSGQ